MQEIILNNFRFHEKEISCDHLGISHDALSAFSLDTKLGDLGHDFVGEEEGEVFLARRLANDFQNLSELLVC